MLNRHAIVLFLGSAAILTVAPASRAAYELTALSDLLILVGLLLDVDYASTRAAAARVLQAVGVVLAFGAAVAAAPSSPALALAEAGIALAVLGVLLEMVVGYGALRAAVASQGLGDALYIAGFTWAIAIRGRAPSLRGWVFIALVGAISVFAAAYNLQLQLRRLRNLQAGWRYRVLSASGPLLRLGTPSGEAQIPWSDVRAVERFDGRHLALFLPNPLPTQLVHSALPVDELKRREPARSESPEPVQFAVILHEQEIGRALPQAEQEFRQLAARAKS
ncbi:MAG TPA: hypothetical protein VFV14_07190 [Myxococcaceae bacterium]|nr:hypothetical protein [Myxococcaceae bacterium]